MIDANYVRSEQLPLLHGFNLNICVFVVVLNYETHYEDWYLQPWHVKIAIKVLIFPNGIAWIIIVINIKLKAWPRFYLKLLCFTLLNTLFVGGTLAWFLKLSQTK